MHRNRLYQAAAAVAVAATVAAGVATASAQNVALRRQQQQARGNASARFGFTSLKWIRQAMTEAGKHGAGLATPKITIGNFSTCPGLPPGDLRGNFLCIVIHITGGELIMGNTNQVINKNMTVPFAEGTDSHGNLVLVPGVLRSSPMPVLGGIFLAPKANSVLQRDPNLRLHVQAVGVGIAIDPTGNTAAIISQKIQAINPIFGKLCSVGSGKDPIVLDPTFGTTSPPPPNQPISGSINSLSQVGHELVIIGTVVDNAFAAPPAQGRCGPDGSLTKVINEVSGLPSAAGTNTAIFQVTVEAISYTNIHA